VRVTLVFPALKGHDAWEIEGDFPEVPRVGEIIKIPDTLYAEPYNRSAWPVMTVHWIPDRPMARAKVYLAS